MFGELANMKGQRNECLQRMLAFKEIYSVLTIEATPESAAKRWKPGRAVGEPKQTKHLVFWERLKNFITIAPLRV